MQYIFIKECKPLFIPSSLQAFMKILVKILDMHQKYSLAAQFYVAHILGD